MTHKNRISALDSLRGLAALAVVFYHYTFRYNEIYGHEIDLEKFTLFKYGHLGVQLFFLISGFVIYLSLNKTNSVKQFAINRFSRLYPAYWVAILITFSAVFLLGLPGREVGASTMLANLTMFHSFLKIPHVDGVYWTLAVELRFYIIVALLYFSLSKKHFLISFLTLIVATLVIHYLKGVWESVLVLKLISFASSSAYLHYFGAGIGFYLLFMNEEFRVAILLICVSLLSNFLFVEGEELVIILSMYLVFSLLIIGKLGFLNKKLFIYLGSISYSLYLIHQNIGYIIINYGYKFGISGYLSILIALSISVLISHFMAKYFEKAVGKKLKQRLSKNDN